jgi:hypothetical protein
MAEILFVMQLLLTIDIQVMETFLFHHHAISSILSLMVALTNRYIPDKIIGYCNSQDIE